MFFYFTKKIEEEENKLINEIDYLISMFAVKKRRNCVLFVLCG